MRRYELRPAPRASGLRRRLAGELNPQQLEVVTAAEGPLLVLAGAGSGKTRTVTYRVAWLLEGGLEPEDLVLLTFTNRAAREMLDRVRSLVPIEPQRLWGGTFHRVANLILRRHGRRLGYGDSFSILDREDSRELIAAALTDLDYDPSERRFPRAEVLGAAFSYAANTQADLSAVLLERWPVFHELREEIGQVAARYTARKRERNAMDYDDLLLNLLALLRDDPQVREHYARRFRHVLVDEYQDTNRLQGEIVDWLGSLHRNVTVVGDDSQSIYSFRGAEYSNIIEFTSRWPGARTLKLEINYRSTPEVLTLANHSIAHNTRQHEKQLRAVRPPGPPPALVALRDASQQAEFVASRVLELRDEGMALAEIAVLYRSHWHSLEIQMELQRRRVPFEVRSGIRFFESAHVKDVLAFLRVVRNPLDEVSWRRLLKLLPRVGNRTAERIFAALAARSAPLAAALGGEVDELVPRAARGAWKELRQTLAGIGEEGLERKPGEMIHRVMLGPYRNWLFERHEDAASRAEDLDQLALFALGFEDADGFLTDLALSNHLDAEGQGIASSERDERLVLSTVHQAKGLEWRAVFVVWLADGRFPSARSLDDAAGEEEERRLFYVAVTRTRDELYLCYPQRGREEYRQEAFLRPSRFLQELEPDDCERWQVSPARARSAPGEGDEGEEGGGRVREPELFDDGPFPDEEGGI